MYPNQGFPGQYPPNNPPFGSGYPPMPQPPSQMPFGAGYLPQQQNMQMPQPMGNYGAPQPPMSNYGQVPQMNPYMQQPPMGNYGAQQPPIPSYGQQPAMGSYGQAPQMSNYGQDPSPAYPQTSQPMYPSISSAQNAFPQSAPNYSSPTAPSQNYGSYGAPSAQHQPIQAQQYASSYSSAPTPQVRRGRPTVVPAPNFDASNDAAALRKAMKGFGTDEDGLINILCRRPCHQRIDIVRAYKTAYGKDLFEDIRSETSGNFQSVMIALLMPKAEYYCRELYEAMVGAGTDEDVLIEVMCTMSNQEIREIGMMYQRMFGQTLESHLRSDTSGNMKRLMTSLSTGNRDESMRTDVNSARQDAESLKRAGVGRFGTDESEFNRILCTRNYEQLKLVCNEYERLTGNPLEKDIKREFSGDIEDALLAIIRVANNRPEFFARRLNKSMAGLGTNDRSLIRLCVTRCEIDMEDIKQEFQRYYGKSLKSFIKGDTSGHYKHALYALCGENRS